MNWHQRQPEFGGGIGGGAAGFGCPTSIIIVTVSMPQELSLQVHEPRKYEAPRLQVTIVARVLRVIEALQVHDFALRFKIQNIRHLPQVWHIQPE